VKALYHARNGSRMVTDRRLLTASLLLVSGFVLVYWQVLRALVHDWISDGNYSHGFLILPLALYFAWSRRQALQAAPIRPSLFGLVIFAGSIAILLAGLLGSEFFLSRLAMLGTIAGVVLFLFGWAHLRLLAFPIAFLLLMIPLPAIIFNQIALPLQFVASRLGELAIAFVGIPVVREGNIIVLAHRTLEVAEACSGIRSLVSLVAVALTLGYIVDPRWWVRTLVALSAVPIAIVTNGGRIAGTAIVTEWLGNKAGDRFFHDFSGWVVFVAALGMIFLVQQALARGPMKTRLSNPADIHASRFHAR
jgi:exosortase